ncbi:hypothetical protein Salat_0853800 [Sesamum alatum]|uniref:Uncharacterized protein n=1 Tax=Sesamum alatum TaxID=300844 RepID=A0AAE1YIK2_9LAMI|nr:hypothetical protein Salat_0853800 [Sesamum alatum]
MVAYVSSQATVPRTLFSLLSGALIYSDMKEISFIPGDPILGLSSTLTASELVTLFLADFEKGLSARMANLYHSRRDSGTPSTIASSNHGPRRSPTRQPPSTNSQVVCTPIPLDGSNNDLGDSPVPISTLKRRRLLISEDSTEGDEDAPGIGISPSREFREAPTMKIDKGKGKVDETSAAEGGFPSVPASRGSFMRRNLEKYEETLKEMTEKWVQLWFMAWSPWVPALCSSLIGTEKCSVLGSGVGGPLLELCRSAEKKELEEDKAQLLKELEECWNDYHELLKGFDVSLLDLGKDTHLEPYNSDGKVIDVPIDNEFYSLLPPEVMDPFIMAARFILSNEDGVPSEIGEPFS